MNPHEAISYLGWRDESTGERGTMTRLKMYQWLKDGGKAYVIGSAGVKVFVTTATTERGTKYVRTYADGRLTNNLLSLQECL